MKNHWTIGIMAALGMILGKLLLPVLGNYIENHSINKVTNSQLKEYIENSSEVNFPFKSYQHSESYYKENFMYKGQPFAPYKICNNYTFYDPNFKKYFAIKMFNYTDFTSFKDILDIAKNDTIKCMVNKQELQNSTFGTNLNPIPVFTCVIPYSSSWKRSDKINALNIKSFNHHYQESVFYHLTYFTPKEEFQKMFPGQK